MEFLDAFSTYRCDYELIEELGLERWNNIPLHREHRIGMVKLDSGAKVELFVKGSPAQFYAAKITIPELNRNITVRTGSGSLSDFWDTFRLVAEDMIVFDCN